jgi:hypothetical protein
MNLLQETIRDIESSGHTPEDIVFIGSEESGHRCTWEQFQVLANIEYDCGYGAQEVATDLIIVFSDGTKMWRHEYDGSERWDFSTPFEAPSAVKEIRHLTVVTAGAVGWSSLAELNS